MHQYAFGELSEQSIVGFVNVLRVVYLGSRFVRRTRVYVDVVSLPGRDAAIETMHISLQDQERIQRESEFRLSLTRDFGL